MTCEVETRDGQIQLPPLDSRSVREDAHLVAGTWDPRRAPSPSYLQFWASVHSLRGEAVSTYFSLLLFTLRTYSYVLVGQCVCPTGHHYKLLHG